MTFFPATRFNFYINRGFKIHKIIRHSHWWLDGYDSDPDWITTEVVFHKSAKFRRVTFKADVQDYLFELAIEKGAV